MLEDLRCVKCFAFLLRTSLEKFPTVVITCRECGHVNRFEYDPARYVKKRPTAESRDLFEEADV